MLQAEVLVLVGAGIKAHISTAPSPRAATPPPQTSPNQLSAVAEQSLAGAKEGTWERRE